MLQEAKAVAPIDAIVRDLLPASSVSIERCLIDCLSACLDVTLAATPHSLPLFDDVSEMEERFMEDTARAVDVRSYSRSRCEHSGTAQL